MSTEKQVTGDIFAELEELKKVDVNPEDEGTYSITNDYGGFFSLICC